MLPRSSTVQLPEGSFTSHVMGEAGPWVVCWPTLLSDHQLFAEFAKALSGEFRLLLIDPPGWGANKDWVFSQQLPELMRVAIAALDELGVDKFHWVGLGLGGQLGVLTQDKHPRRFLSATYFSMPLIRAARVTMLARALQRLLVRTRFGRRKLMDHICAQMGCASEAEAKGAKAHVYASVDRCNPMVLKDAAPTSQAQLDDLRVALQRSTVPSLFVAGAHDLLARPHDQQTAAQLAKLGRFATVDAGFMTVYAQPTQCAAHFREFVSSLTH